MMTVDALVRLIPMCSISFMLEDATPVSTDLDHQPL